MVLEAANLGRGAPGCLKTTAFGLKSQMFEIYPPAPKCPNEMSQMSWCRPRSLFHNVYTPAARTFVVFAVCDPFAPLSIDPALTPNFESYPDKLTPQLKISF